MVLLQRLKHYLQQVEHLNYSTESGKTYTVTGYYKLKSGDTTSNKKSVRLSTEVPSCRYCNLQCYCKWCSYIKWSNYFSHFSQYQHIWSKGHTMIVTCNGNSQSLNCGSSATISGLSSGRSYTISFTEKNSSGETKTIGSIHFTVLHN